MHMQRHYADNNNDIQGDLMQSRRRFMAAIWLGLVGSVAIGAVRASAQEATAPVSLSFNAGAATEYVFRGVSQTD